MIVIVVRANAGESERHEFDQIEISIGADASRNQLVLGGDQVSPRHARLVFKDGRVILLDLRSETGTYVNGRKMTSPMVIRPSDKIYVGNFTLFVGPATAWPDDADATPIVDAIEVRLLSEIGGGDDLARTVYADWLDEHGRPDRAELLRLLDRYEQAEPGERLAIWQRMKLLAQTIERRWRLRVARPVIRCEQVDCPRAWHAFHPTDRKHIRTCGSCQRSVVFCTEPIDASTETGFGNRVAADRLLESPSPDDDLDDDFGDGVT